jgi:hypothetical protein
MSFSAAPGLGSAQWGLVVMADDNKTYLDAIWRCLRNLIQWITTSQALAVSVQKRVAKIDRHWHPACTEFSNEKPKLTTW